MPKIARFSFDHDAVISSRRRRRKNRWQRRRRRNDGNMHVIALVECSPTYAK